jgi:hypothetical protein
MKLSTIILSACLLFVVACSESKEPDALVKQEEALQINENQAVEVALSFVNAYVVNCNQMSKALAVEEWVVMNTQTTMEFKAALTNLVNEAKKNDPEIGLEADPILNAQDYPENGFELESLDQTGNIIHLKGKGQPEFKLNLQMKQENGAWLVNSCGMVNNTFN